MKTKHQFFEPRVIGGELLNDQEKLKWHEENCKAAQRLGAQHLSAISPEIVASHKTTATNSAAEYEALLNNNPEELQRILREEPEKYARLVDAHASMSAEVLAGLHSDHKKARGEEELSTEYGRLFKNDPTELQRILREEPARYEQMANLHALMTSTNG